MEILPGSKVLVFNHTLYENDIDTPLSHTFRPATVIRRYGRIQTKYGESIFGPYEDLVDVVFEHRTEKVSSGHFITSCKPLE